MVGRFDTSLVSSVRVDGTARSGVALHDGVVRWSVPAAVGLGKRQRSWQKPKPGQSHLGSVEARWRAILASAAGSGVAGGCGWW